MLPLTFVFLDFRYRRFVKMGRGAEQKDKEANVLVALDPWFLPRKIFRNKKTKSPLDES